MGKNSDYDYRLRDSGIIHIDKRVLKSFERDRHRMNKGKTGRGFLYSDETITVLAYIHLWTAIQTDTGPCRIVVWNAYNSAIIFSICKRIHNLDLDITAGRKTHGTIAIDSTGIKVTNRGRLDARKARRNKKGVYKNTRRH